MVDGTPSVLSILWIVGRVEPTRRASSSELQLRIARAALICIPVIILTVDFTFKYNILHFVKPIFIGVHKCLTVTLGGDKPF